MKSEKKVFEKRQTRLRWHLKQKNPGKLRLSVFRSNKHIGVQLIDDIAGKTLLSASSYEKDVKNGGTRVGAEVVGQTLASRMKEKKIEDFYFDRGGLHFHGRVKALVDSARKSGLKI